MSEPRNRAAVRLMRILPPLGLLVAGLAAWQVFTALAQVPDWLLPGPGSIWRAAVDQRELLLSNAVPTFEIAVFGFLLALGLGLALAIAIRYSRALELALFPVLVATQSVPLIALAPVLVVALGYSILPKLIMVCLICFFPVVVNAVDGFKSVDPDLVNLMRTLGAGKLRIFRDVEFPAALPFIFSGVKVAAAFAIVGAIVGEWVGSSQGLAYVMTQEQAQFNTPVLFAALAILTLLGVGFFAAAALAERLLMPWYHDERRNSALYGRRGR
jgi:ABC-type nitrate/sulfonate/bicarbonate transport system permease component